jgi:hypothetical protein
MGREIRYFVWPSEYIIKKQPTPTKRAKIILIKVESCSTLLRKSLVCIPSYLKSFPEYKFLILDAYHPYTLYLRQQGCEDLWLFFEAEKVPWETQV